MASNWYLNYFELGPSNGIYINQKPEFGSSPKYNTSPVWLGRTLAVNNMTVSELKISVSGMADTDEHLRELTYYDAHNYNWNIDRDNIYLIKDLTRRWKVKLINVSVSHDISSLDFGMDIITETINSEGMLPLQKTGSLSGSPTTITNCANAGDLDAPLTLAEFVGSYSGGSNLTSPVLTHGTTGYAIDVANSIWDEATFSFYKDLTAKYYYTDTFISSDKFTRNKYSSSNVTFDTDHLVFATSSSLVFKHDLIHPLAQDPVVTLDISNLVGDPVLEVSPDGSTWWAIDKTLTVGTGVDYNLTKLAGYSTFYWRIVCDSNDTMDLDKIIFESWHQYTDSIPIPYIQAGVSDDSFTITYSAGGGTYNLEWRDLYSS